MIKAVIFDVGGPLDLELRHEAAIDLDIREGLQLEGIAVSEAVWEEANRFAVENYAPSLYRAVIWQLSHGDEALARRVYDRMEERATARDYFDLRYGIAETLEALSKDGLKLGLAANQPARMLGLLAQYGIGHYFSNQGISAVYGFRKPDVRLFLRACEDLGVEPGECVMVGDRIDNDIIPARLLGMATVLVRTGRHRYQQPRSWDEKPDVEVEDAAGIRRAVRSLATRSR